MDFEVISTRYSLAERGTQTAVERVSKTKPLSRSAIDYGIPTAQTIEMLYCK